MATAKVPFTNLGICVGRNDLDPRGDLMKRLLVGLSVLVVAALLFVATLGDTLPLNAEHAAKLAPYAFADTRRLVTLVEDAARLMEREGDKAFAEFAVRGSPWYDGQLYLFAYGVDGTCIFHATTPALVGNDLSSLEDLNGKPVVRWITDVGRKPASDASGWVFYLWQDGTQLSPSWKSAYVRKVVMPDGRVVVVGSGLYDIKMEKAFVEERVTNAVALLTSAGKEAAFKAFRIRPRRSASSGPTSSSSTPAAARSSTPPSPTAPGAISPASRTRSAFRRLPS